MWDVANHQPQSETMYPRSTDADNGLRPKIVASIVGALVAGAVVLAFTLHVPKPLVATPTPRLTAPL